MSFSKQVKEELNSIQIKSNCCKKAYLLGALLASDMRDGKITLKLSDAETAEKVVLLLKTIYKCDPEVRQVKRGCYECHELTFFSKKLLEFLNYADCFLPEGSPEHILTCQNCGSAFLRAVFCASGSISDPIKSYALEMRLPNENRASLVCSVIGEWGISIPSVTKRKDAVGLFYRNESSIGDIMTACGANKTLFAFYETSVEKNLRNDENRATNCVARNIQKSVEATALQILAIESLMAAGLFDELSTEIKQSALLRLENPDISLTELAAQHVPQISKSGLNHRLSKVIDEARKRKLI